jgi:hypothetical protein
MHLNSFTEICDMMRIKDVDPNAVKLRLLPFSLDWERMKEFVRNCPNHGMEDWLILHLFYNALNLISKSMLDTAAGGTFMGRPVTVATKLLDDMQNNHAQWHV